MMGMSIAYNPICTRLHIITIFKGHFIGMLWIH